MTMPVGPVASNSPLGPVVVPPSVAGPAVAPPLPPSGIGAGVPVGAPAAPAPPVMPAPVLPPTPPRVPAPMDPTVRAPAQVAQDGTLAERKSAQDISNPFERTATLIVDTAQDWAIKLAANLGEHPSDTAPTDPQTIHEMFNFSPYGLDAPTRFWQQHDEYLRMAVQSNDPDPYAVAERAALDEVYPYRSEMALLDSLGPDERVARADQLLSISHNQMAKGNPHDALASIVGPAGLPQPTTT